MVNWVQLVVLLEPSKTTYKHIQRITKSVGDFFAIATKSPLLVATDVHVKPVEKSHNRPQKSTNMPRHLPYDQNQSTLSVINYLDQLHPGTFGFALHHLVETRLDLSIFNPYLKNDDTGRLAYNPAVPLKII